MKAYIRHSYLFGMIMLLFINTFALPARDKTILSGRVIDSSTGEALIGASVFVPELKSGTTTDLNGKFTLRNLPSKKILIQVSMIGYLNYVQTLDLSSRDSTVLIDFKLKSSIKEINEVVVTGSAGAVERNHTPVAMAVLRKADLKQNSSGNIIDALTVQPGISQVTTGSGISKPVIRGLGYNRVVVVNDNIRQEGQQWGDEHGIEIDENSIDKVEILKGPASLAYGSDAMAGVINFLNAAPPDEGTMTTTFDGQYQTNNGLWGYSLNNAGNKNGFVWDARLSQKSAHSYQNKYDGYVFNSGYSELASNAILGFNKSWGYSHLHLGYYALTPGITEGDRDSTTGKFIKEVAINDSTIEDVIAGDSDFKSYHKQVPFQEIQHKKIVWNNSIIIRNGTLKATIGYQQNQRKEFADALTPDQYGLYFLLNTWNYELKYHLPDIAGFNLSAGFNGMYQKSSNEGAEFLVPAYQLNDAGAFVIASRKVNAFDISGGIRFDQRTIKGEPLYLNAEEEVVSPGSAGASEKFAAFKSTYQGLTGSLGTAWNFSSGMYVKANVSFGFRSPNIAELGANGVHEGTIRYEKGNQYLKAEHSRQLDLDYGINTDHLSLELDLFSNHIDNFIYISRVDNSAGGDSIIDGYNVFRYHSGTALLNGGELSIDLHPHPLDWLHFENGFSYVDAQQQNVTDSMKYLPFTPPAKFTSMIRVVKKKIGKHLTNTYIKAGVESYFRQDHIYSAYQTETATAGYTLINAGLGMDITNTVGKRIASLYFNVSNLADLAYQSHLSRLKYAPENYLTARSGVYNMGRSFSFRIQIPFSFKLAKSA